VVERNSEEIAINRSDLFEDFVRSKLGDPKFLEDKPESYLESLFLSKRDQKIRKEKGQFMTPIQIANLMVDLSLLNNKNTRESLLDPSVGLGIFPFLYLKKRANLGLIEGLSIVAYDIDKIMLDVTKARLDRFEKNNGINLSLRNEDFILSEDSTTYDVIICNPPYIKSNAVKNREKYLKHLRSRYGFEIPTLNNLDSFFLLKSLKLLKPGGTLIFITPNSFLSSVSGTKVREYLLKEIDIEAFIHIDTPEFVFEDGMSSALITYGKKKKNQPKVQNVKFIKIVKFNGVAEVIDAIKTGTILLPNTVQIYPQTELDPKEKWLSKFEEIHNPSVGKIEFVELRKYFRVKRGIATGANSYFTLSVDQVKKWHIPDKYLEPIIVKASYASSPIFTYEDYVALKKSGKRVFLLKIEDEEPDQEVSDYLNYGIKLGVDRKYLCRNRRKWFFVENRDPPVLFVKVFHREKPEFILNKAGVKNLTCFHGLYPKIQNETLYKALILYSFTTYGGKSIIEQTRKYGGGLLKLEPRDVEQIKIPDFLQFSENDLKRIDDLFDSFWKIGYEKLKEKSQLLFDSIFENA